MRNPTPALPEGDERESLRLEGFDGGLATRVGASAHALDPERTDRLVDVVLHLDSEGQVTTWNGAAGRVLGPPSAWLSTAAESLLFTPAEVAAGRRDRALRTAALKGRSRVAGWRAGPDGARFWAEIQITRVSGETPSGPSGHLPLQEGEAWRRAGGFLAVVQDRTGRKRRIDGLRAALEISQAVLGGLPPEHVLRLVARRARSMFQADGAHVVVRPPGADELLLSAADGWNARQATRCSRSSTGAARLGPTLTAPVARARQRIGTLRVYNRVGGAPFGERDLGDLRLLARHAALVVLHSGVRRDRRRLVAEEQARVWRVFQKGAIQSLDHVARGLSAAVGRCGDNALRDQLASCVATVDGVIRDVRNHVLGLPPSILEGRGLEGAVLVLARDLEARAGLQTTVELEAEAARRLTASAGEVVQVVREAFSNVARHSRARRCRLRLDVQGDRAWLQIEDDGVGFLPDQLPGRGQGLSSLRERVLGLGGQLQIDSAPEAGTRLRIALPL